MGAAAFSGFDAACFGQVDCAVGDFDFVAAASGELEGEFDGEGASLSESGFEMDFAAE